MAVQEFLEQAQNVMMSSVGDETSEDMEEKVKMLEVRSLYLMMSSVGKVTSSDEPISWNAEGGTRING